MTAKECLARQSALMWKFLGFFQSPFLRFLHAFIVLLVILQICSSAGMHIALEPEYSPMPLTFVFDWYHILAGLGTLCAALCMAGYSFSQRGLHRYFPYLWGDTGQITNDLRMSLRGELPAPRPGGLATAVQGLGFGALLLTALSGAAWFALWTYGASAGSAEIALNIHRTVVTLLLFYFFGHGGMALLHFILWQRKTVQR